MIWFVVFVYFIGWAIAATLFTRKWYREFGTHDDDNWMGPVWGSMMGLVWPLAGIPWAIGVVARRLIAREKAA